MRDLPLADYLHAFGARPPLVLAPHPDDESLGCGGMIAEACRRGTPPIVAILTDGSRSHPSSVRFPEARLRAAREDEAREATSRLGLPAERLRFLRHGDTQAPREGDALRQAATTVAELAERSGCGSLVASWRHDPHCDHLAASLIAEEAGRMTGLQVLAYPIWGWTLVPDTEMGEIPIHGFRLDVSEHLTAKRSAIAAHRTQYDGIIDDDPSGFQMAPDFIERFLGPTETYLGFGSGR